MTVVTVVTEVTFKKKKIIKLQIVVKLENSNCDETQKLKLGKN